MRTKILAAMVGLIMVATATPSFAGCDGIYLSGKFGWVNHNIGDSSESLGDRLSIDDNAWILAGAIGYRYGYFRFEGEYTWRQEHEESRNYDGGAYVRANFESYSYMGNIYFDFSPYTMFTPYVMAGAGITHLEYTFEGTGRRPTTYEEDNFTWALGAGISAKMTNKWNIDFGYRFLNMGTFMEASYRAHEIYLGTRYVFPTDWF